MRRFQTIAAFSIAATLSISASADVITDWNGTWFGNDAAFTVGSDSYLGFTRSFTSFAQAVQENANSRVYGGIHFRYANEAGIKLGYQIAEHVTSTYLAANELAGGAGGEGGADQSAGGESAGGADDVAGGQPGAAGTGGTGITAGTGGTGAPLAGTAGNATEAEGGAPGEGGAPNTSGGTTSRAGSATRDDDRDSGCSVSAPSGGNRAWLLLLAAAAGVVWRRRRTRR